MRCAHLHSRQSSYCLYHRPPDSRRPLFNEYKMGRNRWSAQSWHVSCAIQRPAPGPSDEACIMNDYRHLHSHKVGVQRQLCGCAAGRVIADGRQFINERSVMSVLHSPLCPAVCIVAHRSLAGPLFNGHRFF